MQVAEILEIVVPLSMLVLWALVAFKKANPARPLLAYTFLTLLPLWLWLCISGLLRVFSFGMQLPMIQKILYTALGVLYIAELLLIPYLLIKLMISPAAEHESGFMANTARGRMANARQQMHYGVYANVLIGVLCVLPICLVLGFLAVAAVDVLAMVANDFQWANDLSPGMLLAVPLIMAFLGPIGWMVNLGLGIVGVLVGLVGAVGAAIILALSLNGSLRALRNQGSFQAKHILYIVAMIIPIVNIIALLRLCGKAKRAVG